MSLHHGFERVWRRWRVSIGDADGLEDAGGVVAAAGDAALGLAVSQVEVDDADGLQRDERVVRRCKRRYRLNPVLWRRVTEGPISAKKRRSVASITDPDRQWHFRPLPCRKRTHSEIGWEGS